MSCQDVNAESQTGIPGMAVIAGDFEGEFSAQKWAEQDFSSVRDESGIAERGRPDRTQEETHDPV